MNLSFYRGKRVFLTGHTGFKGAWMSRILINAGAEITGFSLEPQGDSSLFVLCKLDRHMKSVIGDIRDCEKLKDAFKKARPEIVIHMAAQPIVSCSYKEPAYTYETNVMGTVNILECIRLYGGVKSFLNVTTDKVYHNNEWEWGYRETDFLDGFDPYSNSKSCSELVTNSYKNSFLNAQGVAVSTARAGNAIGGGDFSIDRIIPDCVRAIARKESVVVRNPTSVRPYQHVLEPVMAYLLLTMKQYLDSDCQGCYNIGPDDCDYVTTGFLVETFCRQLGAGVRWEIQNDNGPHEAGFLKLDCSRIKTRIGWESRWSITQAIEKSVEWYRAYLDEGHHCAVMDAQTEEYNNLQETANV